ncbi:ATP-binding protein [Puniceibacterium sp. HSS470]|nr:ATP-binding protein [Puniceibacterium sp. HSS470]|tara:strand:- start:24238 stop:24990 length:753 start_codon:yes stop_codon:yes gene_type:complete
MKMETPAKFNHGVAPLRNVMLLNELIHRVENRDQDLPGLACFYGPSGYGKTTAATWNANETRAYWVEMRESWTRKTLFRAILANMGIEPKKTLPEMSSQISRELATSGRPLLIDEADYLLKHRMIELIREIFEDSKGTIILIGEEHLPQNLAAPHLERTHNRMLDWVAAQPADLREVQMLAQMKCPDLELDSDVQELLLVKTAGRARRIAANLNRIREAATKLDLSRITMKHAEKIGIFTGEAPGPRRDI